MKNLSGQANLNILFVMELLLQMPYSDRTDGKYNRKASYFLVSVKERNMVDFIKSLDKEKKRHSEPKADEVLALGPNQNHKKSYVDLGELFYFLNSYNSMEGGGTFYLRRLKKIIMEQIKKDYEEMELQMPDYMSFEDLQDEIWKKINEKNSSNNN